MNKIPIGKEIADVIGNFAEKVESRSLLFEKFPLPKADATGKTFHDASRWSLLRVGANGSALLLQDADSKTRQSRGQNVGFERKEILQEEAKMARAMSATARPPRDIAGVRKNHALKMRELVEKSFPGGYISFLARNKGRLALNLADGIIENAGMSLDRLLGEPIIRGSAIKGVSREAALWEVYNTSDIQQRQEKLKLVATVFGFSIVELRPNSDFEWALKKDGEFEKIASELKEALPPGTDSLKGGISFLPAQAVSDLAEIVVDLTNVHYPKYYSPGKDRETKQPKLQKFDMLRDESPRPNPFPVVEVDTDFSFLAIINDVGRNSPLPDDQILQAAQKWMQEALTTNGIGAKTGAGYGWFELISDEDPASKKLAEDKARAERQRAEEEAKKQQEAAEKERLDSLSPKDQAVDQFSKMDQEAFANALKSLPEQDEDTQRGYFEVLLSADKKKTLKAWMKKKPKNKEIIEKLTSELGINLP